MGIVRDIPITDSGANEKFNSSLTTTESYPKPILGKLLSSLVSNKAVAGASSTSIFIASDVFPFARDSKYFPRRTNVISIALVSKYVGPQKLVKAPYRRAQSGRHRKLGFVVQLKHPCWLTHCEVLSRLPNRSVSRQQIERYLLKPTSSSPSVRKVHNTTGEKDIAGVHGGRLVSERQEPEANIRSANSKLDVDLRNCHELYG
ncbi:hypothetical protein Ancab_019296 [Ancistrocladus abbreviatus]